MNKERLYFLLPHFLKNVAVTLKSQKNDRIRKRGKFAEYLGIFISNLRNNSEFFRSNQAEELRNLLTEAFKFSDYYGSVFEKLGIKSQDILEDPIAVLNKLPFLEKNTLKKEVENIKTKNPLRKTDVVNFTSGTTGTPTITYYDRDSMQKSFALLERYYLQLGLNQVRRSIRLSGRIIIDPRQKHPPFWVENYLGHQLFISTYHLTKEFLPSIVRKIDSYKPDLIDGYPSAIYIIANFINNRKIKLNFTPTAIVTTAETLYDYQRAEIEKAFRTKTYNQYSSSEGGVFITECSRGRLHLNLDSGIFEFFSKDGREATPGEYAELVATSFRNLKTPLIRYRTGDWVKLSEDQAVCACGFNTPYIDSVIGREDDILYTEEKGYIGRMDTAYKGLRGIIKSQIIQENYDHLLINQVVTDEYDANIEGKFLKNLRDRLGEKIDININIVDEIPTGPNGKFDAVVRKFELPKLN